MQPILWFFEINFDTFFDNVYIKNCVILNRLDWSRGRRGKREREREREKIESVIVSIISANNYAHEIVTRLNTILIKINLQLGKSISWPYFTSD